MMDSRWGIVMNLQMDSTIGENYRSNSQKMRVITEQWVSQNLYCPYCGSSYISHFENNRPVADFYCPNCAEEYELKSKNGFMSNKVNGGAYAVMIERIKSVNNPNFFFLHYDKEKMQVKNLIMVPKYFFVPEIVEKRRPLANTARRAGWTGCNILLKKVPEEGRIYMIKDGVPESTVSVLAKVKKTNFIRQYRLDSRGWILDILNCINKIEDREFTLSQMYLFERELSEKYPENYHIKDKIRQQLQVLRDHGVIEFQRRGHYRKL